MAPKKKSKANKLARMSEDERLRYLQHRAAMEEEVQRRKQELIMTFLKNKLKHEEAFIRLNTAKINQQWRHLLRQIKCKELKEDIETFKQRFEVVLECKDKLIKNLLDDFNEAEFQYSLQFQTHMEAISKFLDLHQMRIQNLHKWFENQLQIKLENRKYDRSQLLCQIQSHVDQLENQRNKSAVTSDLQLLSQRTEYENIRSEVKTTLLYKILKMKETYEEKLKHLQIEYNTLLKRYKAKNNTKIAHYKTLSQKDDADSAQIKKHYEEIADYKRKIQDAKTEYEQLEKTNQQHYNLLTEKEKQAKDDLMQLRLQSSAKQAKNRQQLKMLTKISNDVLKDLKNAVKRSEQITQLANNCCKLKQEPDNLFPAIEASVTDDIPYEKLKLFWKMYNDDKITVEALRKQKCETLDENKKLKKLLQYYTQSIRRSASVPRECGMTGLDSTPI